MDVPGCNVCYAPLDEAEHQPRQLGCSHDACTACIKGLIIDGSFVCPLCRRVIKANKAEDLPINHGVVQILRLFNNFKISEYKQNEEHETINTKEFCSIHKFIVEKRCITCNVWICVECKEFHTLDIGCEVQEYNEALKKLKKEHKEKGELSISSVRKNIRSISSKLTEIDCEKKRLEEEIEKLNNHRKNLEKVFEDGTKVLNEVMAADAKVDMASNSKNLNETVHIANEWHQFAHIWCKTNAKFGLEDSLLEKLKCDQEVCGSMDINGTSSYCKLSFADCNIYVHCFRPISTTPSFQRVNHEQVQTLLTAARDLVFIDLAICGIVMGRVTIRLRQDLPTYSKNIPQLFTGETGHSILGIHCHDCNKVNISFAVKHLTNKINIKKDANAGYMVSQGSILAGWSSGKLNAFYIFHEKKQDSIYGTEYDVFGQVETGLDTVKQCRNHKKQSEVTVVDCGLVINEDLLKNKLITL